MDTPYSDNFDVIVALITHLGATHKASRTPTFAAKDLGFNKLKVQSVLDQFPTFFRKSQNVSKKEKTLGDHFYTLHLRYSRRALDDDENGASQPLSTEEVDMLLRLVTHMVEQEQENSRAFRELEQSYRNLVASSKWTMIAAIAAAVISAIGAVIAVAMKMNGS